jgi:uncharacterized phage protein (TIGR01671 family)
MAREIKFRAFQDGIIIYDHEVQPILLNMTDILQHFFKLINQESPIMQYTGVNDNNNKEAYEGDKIRCFIHGERIGTEDEICFKYGSFWLTRRNISLTDWYHLDNASFEVIGNIYETP